MTRSGDLVLAVVFLVAGLALAGLLDVRSLLVGVVAGVVVRAFAEPFLGARR